MTGDAPAASAIGQEQRNDYWPRVADIVALRRVISERSVVIRINVDGTFEPFLHMPGLYFERPLREALNDDVRTRFSAACSVAVADKTQVVFQPTQHDDVVLIAPVFDDADDHVRFLLCWVRGATSIDRGSQLDWQELAIDQVVTRYRMTGDGRDAAVDVAPWWAHTDGELHEIWPHHRYVTAMGLGHAVIEKVIIDAAEAASGISGGPAVRIAIPSAEVLGGLIPVFHAALRASGLGPDRMLVTIDVELAVDPDLLPIIVHLRTMGLRIDVVGLDALTATLHNISDTSEHTHDIKAPSAVTPGPWVATFAEAASSSS